MSKSPPRCWMATVMLYLLLLYIMLEAQAPQTDALSGGGGWVGAGLLGAVLSWLLLVHLPAKDKQLGDLLVAKDRILVEIIQSKDLQIKVMLEQKWEMMQSLTKDYKEGIKEVTGHCEQEIARLTMHWQDQMKLLTGAIEDLSLRLDKR